MTFSEIRMHVETPETLELQVFSLRLYGRQLCTLWTAFVKVLDNPVIDTPECATFASPLEPIHTERLRS